LADGYSMDEKYWDSVAVDYDGEIFSCLANDSEGKIVSAIEKYGGGGAVACDFGCGVGKFLPALSMNFKKVFAFDISEQLLNQARDKCKELKNISYSKKDMCKGRMNIGRVDFALCINVAIMESREVRSGIFKAISRRLKKGGYLVLVVPSLESALYADNRLLQWNLKVGQEFSEACSELASGDSVSLRRGIVEIDDVRHKHYLKEELEATFGEYGFEAVAFEKVEYCWESEFAEPPGWMGEPYPWDWMAVMKKIKD